MIDHPGRLSLTLWNLWTFLHNFAVDCCLCLFPDICFLCRWNIFFIISLLTIGIRQESPISPYPYILVAQPLLISFTMLLMRDSLDLYVLRIILSSLGWCMSMMFSLVSELIENFVMQCLQIKGLTFNSRNLFP